MKLQVKTCDTRWLADETIIRALVRMYTTFLLKFLCKIALKMILFNTGEKEPEASFQTLKGDFDEHSRMHYKDEARDAGAL
jgi:hypothetical protein